MDYGWLSSYPNGVSNPAIAQELMEVTAGKRGSPWTTSGRAPHHRWGGGRGGSTLAENEELEGGEGRVRAVEIGIAVTRLFFGLERRARGGAVGVVGTARREGEGVAATSAPRARPKRGPARGATWSSEGASTKLRLDGAEGPEIMAPGRAKTSRMLNRA